MNYRIAGLIVIALGSVITGCNNAETGVSEKDVPVCLQGESFIADGAFPLEANDTGDAHKVSGMRWAAHEGCERFMIDFTDEDGNPATAPGDVKAEMIRELGIVRLSLRDVAWVDTDAIEELFEGALAHAGYSVRSDRGRWMYIDLHLAGEAEARVSILEDPARVLVDLRPGGGPVPEHIYGTRVILLNSLPPQDTYPLTLTGYSRTFEANVVARMEQHGEEIFENFTTTTGYVDAWGLYTFTIEEGPSGPIELHVGEYSAKDGTWQGIVSEMEMK